MSAIFGRRGNPKKPAATGLTIQTSSNAVPVPIVWGQAKLSPNIIWYDGFKARKVKAQGGKGGNTPKTYQYSADVILALCEGPVDIVDGGIKEVWQNLTARYLFINFSTRNTVTEFSGSYSQTPWSYLTTKYPSAALAYRGICYLGISNYDLGDTPQVPQHNFEINGILYETGLGGTVPDADCGLLIQDFLTNANYGTPFPASSLDLDSLLSGPDAGTTGDNHYQTYCRAMGFTLSPALYDSKEASSILEHWLDITNSACVWSGSVLKFIPYGDETITANGVTYLPDNPVRYHLNDSHFLASNDEDPIQIQRGDPADAKNSFYVEVEDRASGYELKPVAAKDQASIEQLGLKIAPTVTAHEIKTIAMGAKVAQLLLQRSTYIRNQYSFKLPSTFVLLEAMDIVTLTQETLAMVQFPVRIIEIEEDEEGNLAIIAEDFNPSVSSTLAVVPSQPSQDTQVNAATDPGDVTLTEIIEVPADLTNGVPQIWLAATGDAAQYWGGAQVWISTDDATYVQIGVIDNSCRIGELTANLAAYGGVNPDNVNTVEADFSASEGEFESTDAADAAKYSTLMYCDGEYFAYQDATMTSIYNYDFDVLYRNLYGSSGAHVIGDKVVRLDEEVLKYNLPQDYVGTLLYIKFLSYNMWGNEVQSLADVSPVTFTPTGLAWTLAAPSAVVITPTPVTLPNGSTQITLAISWTPSTAELIDRYEVEVEVDGTGNWVAAPNANAGASSTVFSGGVLANTDYRARVRAVRTSGYQAYSNYATSSPTNSGGAASSAPSAPSNLVATGGAGSAFLTWDASASADVDGYRIYAVNNHSGAFGTATVVGTVGNGTLSFLHGGLSSGALWRYWVTAFNDAGESSPDGPEDITVASAGGGIDVEQNGTPVSSGATTLNFIGATVADAGGGVTDVTITGGGWTLAATHDFGATPQATFDVTGLAGVSDILIIGMALTAAASGFRTVHLSTDNGSTFYTTSGDYLAGSNAGTTSNVSGLALHATASAAARTGILMVSGCNVLNAPKPAYLSTQNADVASPRYFVADNANDVNAIRIGNSGAGNITGGVVYVLTR